jgi:nucleotide-binding universal stress UspA family protein
LKCAQQFGASLRLLHVLEQLAPPFTDLYGYGVAYEPETDFAARTQTAQEEIDKLLAQWPAPPGVAVDRRIVPGLASNEICQQARECQLVVMSTLGRTGVQHLLMGSVAEKVVRFCQTPVLTVHPDGGNALDAVHRVLAPSDLSTASLAALPVAIEWAQRFGAEIDFLLVAEDPAQIPTLALHSTLVPQSYYEDMERRTAAKMREVIGKHATIPARSRFLVRFGAAYKGILAHAQEEKCQLIVLATHGRSGVSHFFLGSVAERVVRLAKCPVISLRDTSSASLPRVAGDGPARG